MAEPKDINEALLWFQADPPVLTKDKKGQVGNQKTKYADLVQAYAVVLPKVTALGMVWRTRPTVTSDGKFLLSWELKHVASGTSETGEWPLRVTDNPQQQGSLVSYARRYLLLTVLNVAAEDEDDDGDAAAGHRYAQRRPPADHTEAPPVGRTAQRASQRPRGGRPPLPGEDPDGPVGADQHRRMRALWGDLGFGGDENREQRLTITAKILELPDLDSSADLTRAQADQVIAALAARKQRLAAPVGTDGDPS